MTDFVKIVLTALIAIGLITLAYSFTSGNCWDQYSTESAAIENCEGK